MLEHTFLSCGKGKPASFTKLKLEGDEIKAMLPRPLSESGDTIDDLCDDNTETNSTSSPQMLLQDLDFLPTKDIGHLYLYFKINYLVFVKFKDETASK